MNEHEWINCVNPLPMLEFLRGKASPRKLRLFSCACCRDVWHLITNERNRETVEVAEGFVEGLASRKELYDACSIAWAEHQFFIPVDLAPFMASVSPRLCPVKMAWATALACAGGNTPQSHLWHDSFSVWNLAQDEVNHPLDHPENWQELVHVFLENFEAQEPPIKKQFQHQTDLLRDIFGNPFHAIEINPAWLVWNEGIISQMAQEIYEARRFGDMPILADALEEAGCREETILEHCRSSKPHVRGCWVLDLLLDR